MRALVVERNRPSRRLNPPLADTSTDLRVASIPYSRACIPVDPQRKAERAFEDHADGVIHLQSWSGRVIDRGAGYCPDFVAVLAAACS
jgi:hypothetical protein